MPLFHSTQPSAVLPWSRQRGLGRKVVPKTTSCALDLPVAPHRSSQLQTPKSENLKYHAGHAERALGLCSNQFRKGAPKEKEKRTISFSTIPTRKIKFDTRNKIPRISLTGLGLMQSRSGFVKPRTDKVSQRIRDEMGSVTWQIERRKGPSILVPQIVAGSRGGSDPVFLFRALSRALQAFDPLESPFHSGADSAGLAEVAALQLVRVRPESPRVCTKDCTLSGTSSDPLGLEAFQTRDI
ncbi:hypothetical protein BJX63DRAFT_314360 [Aspergillus granulosus]|uniref:Uncharacterized protein n=1 Tax=Aspergillus granulosus TaxID=176169 RepID=A0ABR4HY90_9EURO